MDFLYFRHRLLGQPFRDNWGGSDGNGSNPSAGYNGGVNGWSGGSNGSSADPSSPSFVGPPASASPVGDPSNPSFVGPLSSANPAGDPSSPSFVGPQPSASGGLIGQANTSSMPAANTGLASTAANMVNAMQSVNTAEKTATTIGEKQALSQDSEKSAAERMANLIGKQDVDMGQPLGKEAVDRILSIEQQQSDLENAGYQEPHIYPNGRNENEVDALKQIAKEAPTTFADVVKGVLGLVVPGLGIAMSAAENYDLTDDFGYAAKEAIKDTIIGKVAGMLNGHVVKAVGPEIGGAVVGYNKAASVANVFGADMPKVNPAGMLANAVLGKGSSSSGSGSSMGDGITPYKTPNTGRGSGGWSSSESTPAVPQGPAAPSASENTTRVDGRLGLNTAGWAQAVKTASAKRHHLA